MYSLGAILYQCLTGRVPFTSESVLQLLDQIRFSEPMGVREWRKEVPEEVEAVCRKCLHKVPEERYRSAEALADELARIINRWESERLQGDEPAESPVSDYGRVIGLVGLVATVLLGLFIAREAGWFTPRSNTTAPTPAPTKPADTNRQIPTP